MRELEIYIHIPFCVRKCAYCDFLSFAADEEIQKRYTDMLCREIGQWKDRGEYEVSSVFFGGGTPSILPGRELARILSCVREQFAVTPDAEITVECNPGTLDAPKLGAYRAAGVNRLSLGLQSAQDAELRLLGRIHTYADFLESFSLARKAGFSNINVDLMAALPGQKPPAWEDTLKKVLALAPEHISAYSLIIEEGTPFFERYAKDEKRRKEGKTCKLLPSEEEERQMYQRTEELLLEKGYRRYEISNYARPGFACRHNCGYWERKEYLGFGLGAASLVSETRFSNTRDLDRYLQGIYREEEARRLSVSEQMEETMFLGLRMSRGVSERAFEQKFGVSLETVYKKTLQKLERQGLLCREGGRIFLTGCGTDVGNYVFSEFLF